MSNAGAPSKHPLVLAISILVLACVATFVVTVGRDLWLAVQRQPQISPVSVNDQEQIVKGKIDAYDKRAEDLQKLISFLIGLSVLYTLALGVTSYLGLQQTLLQAQETAGKMESLRREAEQELSKSTARAGEKAAEVVREIRNEYPLFGYMDVSLRRIMKELLRLLPFIGWSDQLYGKLTAQQRQEILFYEKTVAGLEFFDLRSVRKDVSKIYDGLGNFYALKFKHEAPHNSSEDLERCRFYLDRATRVDEENIAAWNDIAFVALALESPKNWHKARECSERSLWVDPNQQRARYNLSIVEHRGGNYAVSEGLLTKALSMQRWQEDRYPRRIHNLYYNRACALSRQAENASLTRPERDELIQRAFDDLRESLVKKEYWDEQDRKDLADDLSPGGDLNLVFEKYPREIEALQA